MDTPIYDAVLAWWVARPPVREWPTEDSDLGDVPPVRWAPLPTAVDIDWVVTRARSLTTSAGVWRW